MNNADMLAAENVAKKFDHLEILKNVSLTIRQGEFVALVGKSGSGKTTLLSILSGLEKPDQGRIVLNGKDLTAVAEDELALFRRDHVGFIFQSFNLIPTLSAWENVALPLFPVRMPAEQRRQRALELLAQVEMSHRTEHLPSTLSGGEKQRVAIARALVNHPRIIFADEPTGNLDSATGEAIMGILNRLHKEDGLTLLMVTHEQALAARADRIIKMQDGEVVA